MELVQDRIISLAQSLREEAAMLDATGYFDEFGFDLEASGASEFEVRKSGGPAKELVKEFLSSRWESDDAIRGDASYTETSAAIRELGAFYQKNGQRAKLPPAVAASVGGHLDRARAALDGAGVRKEGLAALLDRGAPADGRG